MAYTGNVDLISGLRPKNGGGFPLVKDHDVYVDDDTRLDVLLASMVARIEALEQRSSSVFGFGVFGMATFA